MGLLSHRYRLIAAFPFLLLWMMFFGCSNDSAVTAPTRTETDVKEFPLILHSDLKLYTQPHLDAPVRTYLTKSTRLKWTGSVSRDVLELERNEETKCYAWIEVVTPDRQAGWIYTDDQALNLDVIFGQEGELPLQVLLSPTTYRSLEGVRASWSNPSSAALTIMSFRTLLQIREQLNQTGRNYPNCWPVFRANSDGGVPGVLIQRIPGEAPHWWVDFRAWLTKSEQSAEIEDDLLFSLYTKVYPVDSVEYFYTAWQFPLPTGEVHSLLGDGTHLDLLQAAEKLVTQDSFIRPDVRRIVGPMIAEILDPQQTFWEGKEKILSELQAICAQQWNVIEAQEMILLHKRKETIANLEDGRQSNLRLGQIPMEPQDSI